MRLIHFFHELQPWQIYAIVIPGLVVPIALAPFLGRHVGRLSASEERSRGALEALKSIVASLVFLLAFLLVQAQGNLQSLERLTTQEASLLNTLDRSFLRYGTDEFTALRATVRDLATTLVEDEWRTLERGERSARAEALLNTLSRRIRTSEASGSRQQSLFTEMVTTLDAFSDRREELIAGATSTLPALFWETVGGLLLVLLILAAAITPNRERLLTMVGVMAAASLIMSLVLITEAPFAGGSQIDPAPLNRVIRTMAARLP